jgi:hypothetical protein
VATGENFPDALAGGQLAGGKYYANPSLYVSNGNWRGAGTVATTPTKKSSSPILLTKDGNRSADSVIASHLAWNWSTYSIDAYDFISGTFKQYLSDVVGLNISPEVTYNEAQGFFTLYQMNPSWFDTSYFYKWDSADTAIVDLVAQMETKTTKDLKTLTDDELKSVMDSALKDFGISGLPTSVYDDLFDAVKYLVKYGIEAWYGYDISDAEYATKGAWIDGYRNVGNNFHGVIFGGEAAVSKKKAEQLDDTVADAIRKIEDPVATYSDTESIYYNGKTYKTLSWLFQNATSWFSTIGSTTVDGKYVAVKANDYNYLYQPYSVQLVSGSSIYDPTGFIAQQTFRIDIAEFARMSDAVVENSYTGYGINRTMALEVTVTYDSAGNGTITSGMWI